MKMKIDKNDKNDYTMVKLAAYSIENERLKNTLKKAHKMRLKEQNATITLTCLLVASIALNILLMMLIIM